MKEKDIDCYWYDSETKTVTSCCLKSFMFAEMVKSGVPLQKGKFNHDKHYIDENGKKQFRPKMEAKLNGKTITDLPIPCTVYINNKIYTCDDDTLELSFSQPGIYRILITSFPYLDRRFQIENRS